MRVAIAGAGIGGMTLAALLDRSGHDVVLVEQSAGFAEVGAGIQISPNGTRVLGSIGLADDLARIGTTPKRIVLRRWEDDSELLVQPLGDRPVERYGHPYYNVYRPDLVDALTGALAGVEIRFGVAVAGASTIDAGAALDLTDGTRIAADVVVGADGIHSSVRRSLFGDRPSRFSRSVAYRALVPRVAVPDQPIEVTNRMGPDRHLVSYLVGEGQRYLNLVCVFPEATWEAEGWNELGSTDELRRQFVGWSSALQAILGHVTDPVYRWALHDRTPLERWTSGRVTLLGDACHPMLPFMAQGACQAIEDAAILARLLTASGPGEVDHAIERYETIRRPRAAELQHRSFRNATTYHLADGAEQRTRDELLASVSHADGEAAFDWLYGYDPLTAPLD